jgi:hypothetical protein
MADWLGLLLYRVGQGALLVALWKTFQPKLAQSALSWAWV